MNKKIFFAIVTLLIWDQSFAKFERFKGFQKNTESVDFFVGQPTVVRYNKFLSWNQSWSADVGYHFEDYYYLGGNYNFYYYKIRDRFLKRPDFFNSLIFNFGPGLFFGYEPDPDKSDDELRVGVRGFAGVEYLFFETNFSIKFELAPVYFLKAADDDFGLQGLVGVAYYFNFPKKKRVPKAEPIRSKLKNTDEFKDFEEFD